MGLNNHEIAAVRYSLSRSTTKTLDKLFNDWEQPYVDQKWETKEQWESRRDIVVPLIILEKQKRLELWDEQKAQKTNQRKKKSP